MTSKPIAAITPPTMNGRGLKGFFRFAEVARASGECNPRCAAGARADMATASANSGSAARSTPGAGFAAGLGAAWIRIGCPQAGQPTRCPAKRGSARN
jgi:hypothetical protein